MGRWDGGENFHHRVTEITEAESATVEFDALGLHQRLLLTHVTFSDAAEFEAETLPPKGFSRRPALRLRSIPMAKSIRLRIRTRLDVTVRENLCALDGSVVNVFTSGSLTICE